MPKAVAGCPSGETPSRSAKKTFYFPNGLRSSGLPAATDAGGDARSDSAGPAPWPSRLSRRPGGSGGDQGGVGNADARGVLDRPYHGLPDEYVDRLGLGPLAAHVDERSLFQPR